MVTGRTKSVKSFREKISRPGKNYSDPLKQVTDLSGIRIVVYYLSDVERVSKLVENEFNVDWANSIDKGKLLAPQEFGYRSIQYVVWLSDLRKRLPEWDKFQSLEAEIQIRTVLQHAWSGIDHKLMYKKRDDVPQQLQRRLFRLAGILELADEEFLSIREAQTRLREESKEMMKNKDAQLKINSLTLAEYFKASPNIAKIVKETKRLGTEKAKIMRAKSRDFSELVTFSRLAKIMSINSLDDFLAPNIDTAPKFYKKIFRGPQMHTTAPYLVIYLIIALHPDIFSSEKMRFKLRFWNKEFLRLMWENRTLLKK
jgi:ppGpp synthetase/RelA/SpoT-type nucleotidyltranferase